MKYLRITVAVLLLAAGICVMLWPRIQGNRIEKEEREAVQAFRAIPKRGEDEPYAELYEAMSEYNNKIYLQHQCDLKDPWSCEQEMFDLVAYGVEDGAVGVLDVPSCGIQMPIYLGASSEHLLKGACVISNTSMPIGGANTNCVIAGHRSMYSAAMFRHLDMIQTGDPVIVTNLWGVLQYKVIEVKIIDPNDVSEILIRRDRDLLTLMTCHPYASGGKQRLIIICERTMD